MTKKLMITNAKIDDTKNFLAELSQLSYKLRIAVGEGNILYIMETDDDQRTYSVDECGCLTFQ